MQILVINGVRVWKEGRPPIPNFFSEYPPPPPTPGAMFAVHKVHRDGGGKVFRGGDNFKLLFYPFGALPVSCYPEVDIFKWLAKSLIISGPILRTIQVMLGVKEVTVAFDDFKAF